MKIKNLPFPFKPNITETELSIAKEFLGEGHNVGYYANYRVTYAGGSYQDFFCRICHAGLGVGSRPPVNPASEPSPEKIPSERVAVTFWLDRKSLPPASIEKYVTWLCEESFVAEFILFRNEKGIVVSGDIPQPLMQNIAILTRHTRELAPKHFDLFNYLYDKLGGDLSYVLAANSTRGGVTVKEDLAMVVTNYGSGHRMSSLFSTEALKNFLSGNFVGMEDAKPFRTHASIYGGVQICWGPKRVYTAAVDSGTTFVTEAEADPEIFELVQEYRKQRPVHEGYRPPNPFERTGLKAFLPTGRRFSLEEVVEVVIPFLKAKDRI